jgi:hypothetical protein
MLNLPVRFSKVSLRTLGSHAWKDVRLRVYSDIPKRTYRAVCQNRSGDKISPELVSDRIIAVDTRLP